MGAGIVGNLWVAMFHFHGFRDVTVSEPAPARRDITNRLGTVKKAYTNTIDDVMISREMVSFHPSK